MRKKGNNLGEYFDFFFFYYGHFEKKKATQSNQSIPFLQQYNMPFLPYTQPSRVLLKHCFPSHRSSPSLSGVRECFERCKSVVD